MESKLNYTRFITCLIVPYTLFLVAAFGLLSMMINQNNYADTISHIHCFLTPTDYDYLFYLEALNDKGLLYTPSVIISEEGLKTAIGFGLSVLFIYYLVNGLFWLESRKRGENKPYHSFFPNLTIENITTLILGISAYCFVAYSAISISEQNIANQNKRIKTTVDYVKHHHTFHGANESIVEQCRITSDIQIIPQNQKSYVIMKP